MSVDNADKQKVGLPRVSDHSIVRYFQYVLEFDIDEIKRDILSPEFLKVLKVSRTGRIPFMEGFRAVVKDNVIVTILNNEKNGKK